MSTNQMLSQHVPSSAVAVTPHDTNANRYSMLYVGTTGNVKIQDRDGNTTTFVGVPAGQYIYCATSLVYSTDTTASNIVGIG